MKNLFLHTLMMGIVFVFSGCAQVDDNLYRGNGELIYLEKPGMLGSEGWKVVFEEFPLSEKYDAVFSFAGLPAVKKVDSYTAYLYVPPTLELDKLDKAVLKMSLYANGAMVSEFSAPMKEWVCTSYSLNSSFKNGGDGMVKCFYYPDMEIPANPQTQYKLEVNYLPSMQVTNNHSIGYYFLQIGGSK